MDTLGENENQTSITNSVRSMLNKDSMWNKVKKYLFFIIGCLILLLILLIVIVILNVFIFLKLVNIQMKSNP
jgi:hypothetical protein